MTNNTSQLSQNYKLVAVYVGFWFFSTFGLLFVALTIFNYKKLQSHPQMLIAYICMAEACMSWNALIQVIGPDYLTCYFGADQIFAFLMQQYE